MTKSELKNGAVVELRNRQKFLKVDNTLLNVEHFVENGAVPFMDLTSFTEDLNHDSLDHKWDIVKANNNVFSKFDCLNNALYEVGMSYKWTWERPKSILDDEEKDYLSKICKPYKVTGIAKRKSNVEIAEFIQVVLVSNISVREHINLPYFKPNTMYKGMELNREYTPAELGLEE